MEMTEKRVNFKLDQQKLSNLNNTEKKDWKKMNRA